MWDGLLMLLSFSIVMGVASFLAGYLPLSFGLSQNHSRIISAIGTGLLVGTCLIIIIPEGIETLYDSASAPPPPSFPQAGRVTVRAEHDEHAHSGPEPHAFVGLSLVAGFILMYLIDEIPKHLASSGASRPMHISLANLSQGPHRASSPTRSEHGDASDEYADEGLSATAAGSATTIGLVIHAAADGIALAASSFIAEKSVGLVVFLAVMIHKAPAAFGLTSVLLKQGLTKRQARAHLVVFSLAAPVGALATWVLVNVLAGGRIEGGQTTQFWTGLLLLFSGGTFLYVAMHTMQEGGLDNHSHEHATNGYLDARVKHEEKQSASLQDSLLVVAGMLLPLLAQVGHAH